jgi:hypothetical protein
MGLGDWGLLGLLGFWGFWGLLGFLAHFFTTNNLNLSLISAQVCLQTWDQSWLRNGNNYDRKKFYSTYPSPYLAMKLIERRIFKEFDDSTLKKIYRCHFSFL